jgi:hypothetical protein
MPIKAQMCLQFFKKLALKIIRKKSSFESFKIPNFAYRDKNCSVKKIQA